MIMPMKYCFQKNSEESRRKKNYHVMKMIFAEQARILSSEGQEFKSLLVEAAKAELRHHQISEVVSSVQILTAGNQSCEECPETGGADFYDKNSSWKICPYHVGSVHLSFMKAAQGGADVHILAVVD